MFLFAVILHIFVSYTINVASIRNFILIDKVTRKKIKKIYLKNGKGKFFKKTTSRNVQRTFEPKL